MSKRHRGRIQAQGDGLEESESWAQDEPLTKKEGLSILEKLKLKLKKSDYLLRKDQFEDAKRFIENIDGGIDAVKKKTFRNRKTKDARIDIEILGGTAFITVILIILIYYFF
ncbi:MAG: hypothetical protein DWQ02_25755 [Bacteroidetes bacterium]|nr:MAG: hypothetical protein DWQ02_25755 [Bacteroidota bacterium]